jgi:hypothetical protein
MQRILVSAALLFSMTFAVAAVLEGQDTTDNAKGKDKVTKVDATLEDYQNLAKLKDVTGKIAAVDVMSGTMTLTVDWSHLEPNKNFNAANQKAQQQQQQIQRDYNQIMQAKNSVQRQQALARLQTHVSQNAAALDKMFTTVKATKDFDLVVQTSLKVARSAPEQKYDEEGGLVKYTDAELKKMKSPDVNGAYTAKPEDLKVGQGVKLFLDPPKDDKKKSDKADTGTADSKDTKSGSTQQMPLSQVRMALITDESNVMDPPDNGKKKKKKDN